MNNNYYSNNEILFWKVFHNKYIFNFIFQKIYEIGIEKESNSIDGIEKYKFEEIESMQFMIKNKLFNLLKCKLISNDQINIISLKELNLLYQQINNNNNKTNNDESFKTLLTDILLLLLNKKEKEIKSFESNLLNNSILNSDNIEIIKLFIQEPYNFKIKSSMLDNIKSTSILEFLTPYLLEDDNSEKFNKQIQLKLIQLELDNDNNNNYDESKLEIMLNKSYWSYNKTNEIKRLKKSECDNDNNEDDDNSSSIKLSLITLAKIKNIDIKNKLLDMNMFRFKSNQLYMKVDFINQYIEERKDCLESVKEIKLLIRIINLSEKKHNNNNSQVDDNDDLKELHGTLVLLTYNKIVVNQYIIKYGSLPKSFNSKSYFFNHTSIKELLEHSVFSLSSSLYKFIFKSVKNGHKFNIEGSKELDYFKCFKHVYTTSNLCEFLNGLSTILPPYPKIYYNDIELSRFIQLLILSIPNSNEEYQMVLKNIDNGGSSTFLKLISSSLDLPQIWNQELSNFINKWIISDGSTVDDIPLIKDKETIDLLFRYLRPWIQNKNYQFYLYFDSLEIYEYFKLNLDYYDKNNIAFQNVQKFHHHRIYIRSISNCNIKELQKIDSILEEYRENLYNISDVYSTKLFKLNEPCIDFSNLSKDQLLTLLNYFNSNGFNYIAIEFINKLYSRLIEIYKQPINLSISTLSKFKLNFNKNPFLLYEILFSSFPDNLENIEILFKFNPFDTIDYYKYNNFLKELGDEISKRFKCLDKLDIFYEYHHHNYKIDYQQFNQDISCIIKIIEIVVNYVKNINNNSSSNNSGDDIKNNQILTNVLHLFLNFVYEIVIKIPSITSHQIMVIYKLLNSCKTPIRNSFYHSFFYLSIKSKIISRYIMERLYDGFIFSKLFHSYQNEGYLIPINQKKRSKIDLNNYLNPDVYTFEYLFGNGYQCYCYDNGSASINEIINKLKSTENKKDENNNNSDSDSEDDSYYSSDTSIHISDNEELY